MKLQQTREIRCLHRITISTPLLKVLSVGALSSQLQEAELSSLKYYLEIE